MELVFFPEGKHILELPLQRVGSMQGSVDWFRYWLQGYENPNPQYPEQSVRWRALRAQHEWNERLIAAGKDPAAEFIKRRNRSRKPLMDTDNRPWYRDLSGYRWLVLSVCNPRLNTILRRFP